MDRFLRTDGARTRFAIDALGVDISQLSAHPTEAELLLLPGTRLVAEPGTQTEADVWDFNLRVQEPSPSPANGPGATPLLDFLHPGWGEAGVGTDVPLQPRRKRLISLHAKADFTETYAVLEKRQPTKPMVLVHPVVNTSVVSDT